MLVLKKMLVLLRNCKKYLNNMSLKTKLVAIFVILTIIPLGLVGFVSFTQSLSTIEEITINSTTQIAEQLNQSIMLTFQMGERFSKIAQNEAIIKFLTIKDDSGDKTYESAKEIIKLFKLYRDTFDDYQWIKGIYIIGFNGNNISEAQGVYKLHKDIDSISTVNRILSEPNKTHIIPNTEIDYARKLKYQDVISLGTVIVIPTTNHVVGVMIIDIDKTAIEELCKNIVIGNSGYFAIISKEDSLVTIFNSNLEENIEQLGENYIDKIIDQRSGHFIAKINGRKEFIVFNTLSNIGWKIIGRVELKDLMRSAYTIRTITIIVTLLCIVFTAILYLFISEKLTLPIRNLKNKMKQAEGENFFATKAEYGSMDEIGELYRSFNKMLEKIRQLIENNKREQQALKKSELKALQAQINPHFLYNTLDAIVWMSEANNNAKVVEITKALSNFFRIALSKGKEWITVNEEVEHTRSYLIIQSMRYRDVLNYSIDIDNSILNFRILKLILQPIVENALYHGIKNKRTPGFINVKAKRISNGKLLLEVIDNGNGMTGQRLKEVVEGLNNDGSNNESLNNESINNNKKAGFGLRNVNQRIKLYYGKQYGLTIKSEYKKGTCVSIIIPEVGCGSV
ncbi:MAG: sensor histidine kinase [Acetivibrionales bacterium]|jgi:two-component system sensor histidine kinase YesM